MTSLQSSSLLFTDVPVVSRPQDIHISCPIDLVEPLVAEFERQFATNAAVEIYDWGQSARFQQGFIILSFDSEVPLEFERQLDADPRLEGHSLYNLPVQSFEPLFIAGKRA